MTKRALAALSTAVALSGCMSVNVSEDAFFYPDSRLKAENIVLPAGRPTAQAAETMTLSYAGGVVGATRVRTGRADAPLILFCGGNMFRRSNGAGSVAEKLSPFGDVLMFDYPGYGDTQGTADYASFYAAGEVVAQTARAQANAEGRRLIGWGHSLGGPVCASAAAFARADALVLETTTPSARAAVNAQVGWLRPLVRVHLAPQLGSIDVPETLRGYAGQVVVLEAGRDRTLSPSLSRRLARELQAEGVAVQRLVFPQADHQTVDDQPDFRPRLAAALNLPPLDAAVSRP